jgi:hypothetical protein
MWQTLLGCKFLYIILLFVIHEDILMYTHLHPLLGTRRFYGWWAICMEFWVSSSIKTPSVPTGPSKVFLQLKQWVSMILSLEQKDLCIFLCCLQVQWTSPYISIAKRITMFQWGWVEPQEVRQHGSLAILWCQSKRGFMMIGNCKHFFPKDFLCN